MHLPFTLFLVCQRGGTKTAVYNSSEECVETGLLSWWNNLLCNMKSLLSKVSMTSPSQYKEKSILIMSAIHISFFLLEAWHFCMDSLMRVTSCGLILTTHDSTRHPKSSRHRNYNIFNFSFLLFLLFILFVLLGLGLSLIAQDTQYAICRMSIFCC